MGQTRWNSLQNETKSKSLALFLAELWAFEVLLPEKDDFEENAYKVLKCPFS